MTRDELIEFLRDNLTVDIDLVSSEENDRNFLTARVILSLCGEPISSESATTSMS